MDVEFVHLDNNVYTSTHIIPILMSRLLRSIESSYYTLKFKQPSECNIDVVDDLTCTTKISIPGSSKFCRFVNSGGDIKIGESTGAGFFSTAGPLCYNGNKIYVSDISIDYIGGTFSFNYMEVIAKQSKVSELQDKNKLWSIYKDVSNIKAVYHGDTDYKDDRYISYIMSDPLYEAVIGSFLSVLYESGMCPSIPKYIGFYSCPGNRSISNTFILQKSDMTFLKFITEENLTNVTVYDIFMLVFQVAHSFSMMKHLFGITHFDAHIGNVMITLIKNVIYGGDVTKSTYGGKDLSKVDYIRYHLPLTMEINGVDYPVVLNIENNGLLAKVIDFGLSYVDFNRSITNKQLPFRFLNRWRVYELGGFSDPGVFPSDTNEYNYHEYLPIINNTGDSDFNYFFNILITYLGRSANPGTHQRRLFIDDDFRKFVRIVSEGFLDIDEFFSSKGNLFGLVNNGLKWGYNNRFSSGRNSSHLKPLENILGAVISLGGQTVITDGQANLFINRNGVYPVDISDANITNVISPDNFPSTNSIITNFFNSYRDFYTDCVINGVNNQNQCNRLKNHLEKTNPSSVLFYDFYNNIVNISSGSDIITLGDLQQLYSLTYKRNEIDNLVSIHKIRILPRDEDIPLQKLLEYKSTHRLFDYTPPPGELIGTPLENVTLNLIYLNGDMFTSRVKFYRENIYDIAKNKVNVGAVINGGYFIVPKNLENKLTLHEGLTKDDLFKPIGYYYNINDPDSGTRLPFPFFYDELLATVYFDTNGKLHMMRSVDFKSYHELEDHTYYYETGPNIINSVISRNVIRMSDRKPVFSRSAPSDFNYISAMETGPILIWDGNIVFNDELFNADFEIEGQACRVDQRSRNAKGFYNEPGESCFLYGQRSSNSFMIHNVLCITHDGLILVVLVEGRGYDAIGLDRAQLAKLLQRFNVKHAVSLDGGFSAGAVVKQGNYMKWISIDPERRPVSTSIIFNH